MYLTACQLSFLECFIDHQRGNLSKYQNTKTLNYLKKDWHIGRLLINTAWVDPISETLFLPCINQHQTAYISPRSKNHKGARQLRFNHLQSMRTRPKKERWNIYKEIHSWNSLIPLYLVGYIGPNYWWWDGEWNLQWSMPRTLSRPRGAPLPPP